jgi:putative nucleotidyltransferase with HDIG domain
VSVSGVLSAAPPSPSLQHDPRGRVGGVHGAPRGRGWAVSAQPIAGVDAAASAVVRAIGRCARQDGWPRMRDTTMGRPWRRPVPSRCAPVDPATSQLLLQRLPRRWSCSCGAAARRAGRGRRRAADPRGRARAPHGLRRPQVRVDDPEATETARRTAGRVGRAGRLVRPRGAERHRARRPGGVRLDPRGARADGRRPTAGPGPGGRPPSGRSWRGARARAVPREVVAALVGVRRRAGRRRARDDRDRAGAGPAAGRADELERLLADTLPIELALRNRARRQRSDHRRPLIEQFMRPTVVVDPDATGRRGSGPPRRRGGRRVWPRARRSCARARSSDADGSCAPSSSSGCRVRLGGGLAARERWRCCWSSRSRRLPVEDAAACGSRARSCCCSGAAGAAYAGLVSGSRCWSTRPRRVVVRGPGRGARDAGRAADPPGGRDRDDAAGGGARAAGRPAAAGGALFAARRAVSVPLTTRIAKRSDLRSATLRAGLSYPVLAARSSCWCSARDELFLSRLAAGALNGVITALAVQGALPFLETLFRLPTVTALLDLADRNHPLLRELETKALGSYNHSVMVASLTERACRAIGADPLLGSVAALYHDIGKVRQPHFFIENQQGIANPHDDLEPRSRPSSSRTTSSTGSRWRPSTGCRPRSSPASAATTARCSSATSTTRRCGGGRGGDRRRRRGAFRYQGHKPRSKEAAILLLADCCEATTRAMAMSRGTLPREEIEATVDRLLRSASTTASSTTRPDLPRAADRARHDRRVAGGHLPPADRLPGQAERAGDGAPDADAAGTPQPASS